MAQPDQVCIKCAKPVGTLAWLPACGHIYHVKCLTCERCGDAIQAGAISDFHGLPYHRKCADELKREMETRRCNVCGKGLEKKGVVCKDYYYHKECFKCTECSTVLPLDNWYDKDDKVYCQKCFDKNWPTNCYKCNSVLTGNIMVTMFGSFFCGKCLKCINCRKQIVGMQYFELGGDLFCKDCDVQYRNKKYMFQKTRTGTLESKFKALEALAKEREAKGEKPAEPPAPPGDDKKEEKKDKSKRDSKTKEA